MNRFILLLMTLATLPMLAQTKVNSFFSGTNEGITYALPDTRIEVTVNAACITRTPGEFYRYAERYLRIDNAISEVETHWVMTDVKVTTSGKPNPEKMYTVVLNNSTASNISLGKNGVIEGINTRITETKEAKTTRSIAPDRHIDATRYMTEEMLQATSTAKLAELTAKEIYTIRESKLDITRGFADNMPKDGLSMQLILDELNRQEQAYTELFTGHVDTVYYSHTYTIEPTYGNDITKEILMRFSRKLGFVENDDLAGEPVYYSLHDMKTVHIPTKEELEKKKTIKKEGVCYNIPGKASLSIFTRSKKLYNDEISIAQFGVTEVLSRDLFSRKANTKVLFDTSTGGIISIEK